MEKCGDCRFYHWGTCHGLPPMDKFLQCAPKPMSVRPSVREDDYVCSLFKEKEKL